MQRRYATETSERVRVREVLSDVQARSTFGCLTRGQSWAPPLHDPVARADLEAVSQRADHVLVGAYDTAGTLIWSRQE
jgi:hypothetical protein